MGVYIKGMEMPKRGHTVTITIVGSGEAYVEYYDCRPHIEEEIEYKAIPVPDHGDLIDLSAKIVAQYYDEMTEDWLEKEVTVEDVIYGCIVDEMPPTIIPADKEGEG